MADLALRKNLGTTDRALRLVLGAAMVAYPALASWAAWLVAPLAALGGAQLWAGATGY